MVVLDMASSSSSDAPNATDEPLSAADGIAGTRVADDLLNKIASVTPESRFKSLQINDPDLSFDEKRQIAADILTRSPAQFLARFGEFLGVEDLVYFDRFVGCDYAVEFYANEIGARRQRQEKQQQRLQQSSTGSGRVVRDVRVKNRRYEALLQLIGNGEYFCDVQMKRRNPFMFEQMIGQYMTARERDDLNKSESADMKLSTFLMEHIDCDQEENLRQMQQAEEVEEEDSSSEDEGDDESHIKSICTARSSQISDQEKLMFREEFTLNMHHNFLDGKDEDFNYSSVDDNADYDPIKAKQQDAEDDYFDAEDPKTVTPPAESNSASEDSMDYDAPITCFVKSDIGLSNT